MKTLLNKVKVFLNLLKKPTLLVNTVINRFRKNPIKSILEKFKDADLTVEDKQNCIRALEQYKKDPSKFLRLQTTYNIIATLVNAGLTDKHIKNFNDEVSEEFTERDERAFKMSLLEKNFDHAIYIVNNNKRKWSVEKRKSMLSQIPGDYVLDIMGNVNTKHGAKKLQKFYEKEKARQQGMKNMNDLVSNIKK